MQLGADDLDTNQGGSPSVWPSYVAAVASVVLCVLLLISVLAVVVNQFSVFAKKTIDQTAQAEHASSYLLNEINPVGGENALDGVGGFDYDQADRGLLLMVKNIDQLKGRLDGLLKANGAAKMRSDEQSEILEAGSGAHIEIAKRPVLPGGAVPVSQRWVFAFESGAFDLDSNAEVMLRELAMENAGNNGLRWRLDVGVAGLSDVAIREVFELANRVRVRLIDFGVSQSLIDLKLHKYQTQAQVALNDFAADGADLYIVLRVNDGRSSR